MNQALEALKDSSPLVRSIVAAGAALMVLSLLSSWESLGSRARRCGVFLTAAMTLAFGASVASIILRNAQPPEWDFRAFWLYGRAMTMGENPYHPAALRRVVDFDRSSDFDREVIDVGCVYPPSSLSLFYPLGLMAARPSYLLWMATSVLAGIACIALIAAQLQATGWIGVASAGSLLAAFVPSWVTINTAQTHFLLLSLLLLLLRGYPPFVAGAWLGLAIVVKPLAAILLLLLAASVSAWRTVAGAIVVVMLATLCTVWLVGPGVLGSYMLDNPGGRLPDWVYTESINQSMLAVLTRAAAENRPTGSTMATYATVALVLGICTVWLSRLVSDEDRDLRLGVGVAFALAVYPGTLSHYSLLLLVPFLAVWNVRHRIPGGPAVAVGFGTAIWGLLPLAGAAFLVNCATWAFLATVILLLRRTEKGVNTLRAG